MSPTTTSRRPPSPRPTRAAPAPGPARPPMDPRIRQRRAAVTRSRGRRRLWALIGTLAVATVAVLAWYVLHTSVFSARVVTVRGDVHTPAAAVVAAAGLSDHPPLVSVDPTAAALAVERLPWVATASVQRQWPDGVTVTVTERVPVAAIAVGPHAAALVDGTGRVLADVAAAPAGMLALHQPGTAPAPGATLPPAGRTAAAVAAALPAAFRAQVTGVTVDAAGDVDLTLTSPVTVDLGSSAQLGAKFEAAAAVLAGATLHPGDVIDVTVPGAPTVNGP